MTVAGEQGGRAQQRHPPLAHVRVERLPASDTPPPPSSYTPPRHGGVRTKTRRRAERPLTPKFQRTLTATTSGRAARTTRRVSRPRQGAGTHHVRAGRGEPPGVHRDGEVGGGAQRPDEESQGQGAEVGGDGPGPAPRPEPSHPSGRASSRQISPKEWTRWSAAAVATTGRAGSRSRWARWSPSRSGSIHGTRTAEGSTMTRTRSATVRAGSRSRPANSHVDQPTEGPRTIPGAAGHPRAPAGRALARPGGGEPDDGEGDLDASTHATPSSAARGPPPGARGARRRAAPGGRSARRGGTRAAPLRRRGGPTARLGRPVDDVGVVRRRDDGAAGGPVGGDEPDEGRPRAAVLADRRLVGEEDRRAVQEGGGDGEPALLATGEVARVGVLEVDQAERGEQGAGPALRRGVVAAEGARGGQHLVEHRGRDDRRARPLRHPGQGGGEVGGGQVGRSRREPSGPATRTASGSGPGGSPRVRAARSTSPSRSARRARSGSRGGRRAAEVVAAARRVRTRPSTSRVVRSTTSGAAPSAAGPEVPGGR